MAKAGVKHPQSNEKVERAGQTLQQLGKHFTDWDETVYTIITLKDPHSSLENGNLRIPYEAFIDKMTENKKKGC